MRVVILVILSMALSLILPFKDAIPDYVNGRDYDCMVLNVYYESRGEPTLGQELVALTTLTRVDSRKYPNDICSVVYQRKQFSWTNWYNDSIHRPKMKMDLYKKINNEIVMPVMRGEISPKIANIKPVMFHNDKVTPYWVDHYTFVADVGGHLFYEEP